jgi:uncharacterized protein YggE
MKAIAAATAAVLLTATPAAAQDIAGPVAAAIDQMGQGLAESMHGGPGIFVTAQGRAPMPAAADGAPMTLTVKGEGKTAVEAAANRNAQLERIRAVANNFDVAIEVGATNYSISETPDWMGGHAMAWTGDTEEAELEATVDEAAAAIESAAAPAAEAAGPVDAATVTASVQVKIQRPNETLSLLGLDTASDPGEPVWNDATADGVARARAQAQSIAAASGRQLGPVRYVSVLMRSHDGENALVSVAVRFGFAD